MGRIVSQACDNRRMIDAAPDESRCARCGAAFRCAIADAGGCWCARRPAVPRERLDPGTGCLCPACLATLAALPRDAGGHGAA
jgi:hypothetical protein